MIRIQSILIAGALFAFSSSFSVSWGQATPNRPTSLSATGTALIEGLVVDAATRQPLPEAVVSIQSQDNKITAKQRVDARGAYQFTVDPKQQYIITTSAVGYEELNEQFAFTSSKADWIRRAPIGLHRIGTKPAPTTAGTSKPANPPASTSGTATGATATQAPPPPVQPPTAAVASNGQSGQPAPPASERVTPPKTLDAKVIYTPPLVVAPTGKTTQLRAIQFVQSKAELLPDAQPALDQLLAFLRDKPSVEIELAGHTDNQGDFDQNLLLSKQRVELVKDYLVKNGIAANRITTRGYGPTRPIASNNSEATRQLNRRVEMVVVKQ